MHPTGSVVVPSAGTPRGRWEGAGELGRFRAVGGPFVSRGHFAGRWTAEILVNDVAGSTYPDELREHFAVGSILVKKHHERSSSAPGPIFVMVKREAGFFPQGGDWEYIATDPEGWVQERGQLAMCARCHSEAKSDWTFGPPHDSR